MILGLVQKLLSIWHRPRKYTFGGQQSKSSNSKPAEWFSWPAVNSHGLDKVFRGCQIQKAWVDKVRRTGAMWIKVMIFLFSVPHPGDRFILWPKLMQLLTLLRCIGGLQQARLTIMCVRSIKADQGLAMTTLTMQFPSYSPAGCTRQIYIACSCGGSCSFHRSKPAPQNAWGFGKSYHIHRVLVVVVRFNLVVSCATQSAEERRCQLNKGVLCPAKNLAVHNTPLLNAELLYHLVGSL